jgi:hypothetical protein
MGLRIAALLIALLAHAGCSRLTFLPEAFQHLPGQGLGRYAGLPNINLEGFLPGSGPSVKFAVIGDSGSGTRRQYEIGQRLAEYRKSFPFDLVLMLGDNIYGDQTPKDFVAEFEQPYKPLLDGGVKFYAALGNHDSRDQRLYKPFNMNGKTYYSFKAPTQDVRFFVLETDYMDAKQLAWLENELKTSKEIWKICYFHHPLYSSVYTVRTWRCAALEPLFVRTTSRFFCRRSRLRKNQPKGSFLVRARALRLGPARSLTAKVRRDCSCWRKSGAMRWILDDRGWANR